MIKTGFSNFGGAEGVRTPDLMTASHAFSQLNYGPTGMDLKYKPLFGSVKQ